MLPIHAFSCCREKQGVGADDRGGIFIVIQLYMTLSMSRAILMLGTSSCIYGQEHASRSKARAQTTRVREDDVDFVKNETIKPA